MLNFKFLGKKQQENPRYSLLKRLISKDANLKKISKGYHIGGFVYDERIYENVKSASKNGDLHRVVRELQSNTQKDNVEIYLLKNYQEEWKIVLLMDYFELYTSEEILDVLPLKEDLEFFKGKKLICQFPLC